MQPEQNVKHFGGTQFCESFVIDRSQLNPEKMTLPPEGVELRASTSRGVIPWKGGSVKVALSFGSKDYPFPHLSPVGIQNIIEWEKVSPGHIPIIAEVSWVRKSHIQKLLDIARAKNAILFLFTEKGDVLDELGELLFGHEGWVNPVTGLDGSK